MSDLTCPRYVTCPDCDGSGTNPDYEDEPCETCDGRGEYLEGEE